MGQRRGNVIMGHNHALAEQNFARLVGYFAMAHHDNSYTLKARRGKTFTPGITDNLIFLLSICVLEKRGFECLSTLSQCRCHAKIMHGDV